MRLAEVVEVVEKSAGLPISTIAYGATPRRTSEGCDGRRVWKGEMTDYYPGGIEGANSLFLRLADGLSRHFQNRDAVR